MNALLQMGSFTRSHALSVRSPGGLFAVIPDEVMPLHSAINLSDLLRAVFVRITFKKSSTASLSPRILSPPALIVLLRLTPCARHGEFHRSEVARLHYHQQ